MKEDKIIASLNYFSVFFAPFILPIILYFVCNDFVKSHAKKALISHLIPYVILCSGIAAIFILAMLENEFAVYLMPITVIIVAIVTFICFVWNIIKGVQVLR